MGQTVCAGSDVDRCFVAHTFYVTRRRTLGNTCLHARGLGQGDVPDEDQRVAFALLNFIYGQKKRIVRSVFSAFGVKTDAV